MFKKFKSVIIATPIIALIATLAVAPLSARADLVGSGGAQSAACSAVQGQPSNGGGCGASSGKTVNNLVSLVISILSYVIGIISVIMIIIGGFRMITSNGDTNAMSSGRNAVLYALIGLAIAAVAQLLVHFVLAKTINATSNADNIRIGFIQRKILT